MKVSFLLQLAKELRLSEEVEVVGGEHLPGSAAELLMWLRCFWEDTRLTAYTRQIPLEGK